MQVQESDKVMQVTKKMVWCKQKIRISWNLNSSTDSTTCHLPASTSPWIYPQHVAIAKKLCSNQWPSHGIHEWSRLDQKETSQKSPVTKLFNLQIAKLKKFAHKPSGYKAPPKKQRQQPSIYPSIQKHDPVPGCTWLPPRTGNVKDLIPRASLQEKWRHRGDSRDLLANSKVNVRQYTRHTVMCSWIHWSKVRFMGSFTYHVMLSPCKKSLVKLYTEVGHWCGVWIDISWRTLAGTNTTKFAFDVSKFRSVMIQRFMSCYSCCP